MEKEKFKLASAVYLILKQGNQVLLLKRKNIGKRPEQKSFNQLTDRKWSVIAGHLDGNEKATAAIIREAQEEAGITLNPTQLTFTHVSHNYLYGNEYINFFFVATEWTGELKNIEPEKCEELQWFNLNALPEDIIPYIKTALLNSENHIPYSESWE